MLYYSYFLNKVNVGVFEFKIPQQATQYWNKTGYWRHGTCLICSKSWFEGRKMYLGLITAMPSWGSNFFYLDLTHSNPQPPYFFLAWEPRPKSVVSQTHGAAGSQAPNTMQKPKGLLVSFSPGGYWTRRYFSAFYFPGLHVSAPTVHSGSLWEGTHPASQLGGKAATRLNPAVATAADYN